MGCIELIYERKVSAAMYSWGSGSNDVTGLDQTVSSCDVIVDGKSCVVPACVDGANCNTVLSIDDVTDGGGAGGTGNMDIDDANCFAIGDVTDEDCLIGRIIGARRDSTGSVGSGDEYV